MSRTSLPSHSAALIAAVTLALAGGSALGCRKGAPAVPVPTPAAEDSVKIRPVPALAPLSATLPPVDCPFAGDEKTAARVSVTFHFTDKALKTEITGKTEELIRLLKFVLSTKRPAEINAESLRAEFKSKLYPLLPPEKLDDITFQFELFLKDSL